MPAQRRSCKSCVWALRSSLSVELFVEDDDLTHSLQADLEPPNAGKPKELTPQRLAAFYNSCALNYDSLFLGTSSSGLSYIYKTLGCFHSLLPAASPFESPSIPALTPEGYARWQTIQIVLCPNETVPFMQEAVRRYDVPRADGGFFPKHLPKTAFPDKPDPAMEGWYQDMSRRLERDREIFHRNQNSPYLTPNEGPDRRSGYFPAPARPGLLQARRPSKPARNESTDYDLSRRRSSVPDLPSPHPEGVKWAPGTAETPTESRKRTARSHSAQRPTSSSSHHKPSAELQRSLHPSHRTSGSSSPPRSGSDVRTSGQPPFRSRPSNHSSQPPRHRRAPSSVDESSGSEASSEDSRNGHPRNRKSSNDRPKQRSLFPYGLLPDITLPGRHHRRRHSHDVSNVSPEKAPPLPPRPALREPPVRNGSVIVDSPVRMSMSGYNPPNYNPVSRPSVSFGPGGNMGTGVRFRDHIFDARDRDRQEPSSASTSTNVPVQSSGLPSSALPFQQPAPIPAPPIPPPPQNPRLLTYDVQSYDTPLTRQSSGSGSGSGGNDYRSRTRPNVRPLRVATVTGVDGRRYPENNTSKEHRPSVPTALPV